MKNTLRYLFLLILIVIISPVTQADVWSATSERAYVANYNSNSVSVIDTSANTVLATVAVGASPYGVTVNPSGTRVYVTNNNGATLSVIDTGTNTVVSTIPVGIWPHSAIVNPAGTRIYVTNYDGSINNVKVIDASTNTVVSTVTVGSHPSGISVNPAGTRVYVANTWDNTVSVIDTSTNTVVSTIAMGSEPLGVSVNPAGTRVYVTNRGSGTLSVIDTSSNTVVATITVGASPYIVSINPSGTRAYVANYNGNSVSVIDTSTNTVVATVAVSAGPQGLSVNPAGTRVYATNPGNNSVSAIDTSTNTVVSMVVVGASPYSLGNFIANIPILTATTTAVASSLNPSTSGSPVTFTATVTSGATGTVTFKDGSASLGTGIVSGGTATYSTSSLSLGSHAITAVYNGDNNYSTSTSSALTQTVDKIKIPTTTSLTASPDHSNYLNPVRFTANVSGTNPTGTVSFMDGTTTIGTDTLKNGSATYTMSSLGVGTHSISAVYSGDSNFSSSTSSVLTQTVNPASNIATTINIPANISGARTGTFKGEGKYSFFSVSMNAAEEATVFGTKALNKGTFKNSDNGVTGSFETTGFTLDGTPMLFYTWGGKCPGGFFLTQQSQGNDLATNVLSALDCNGEASKVAFTMNPASGDMGSTFYHSSDTISKAKPVEDRYYASDAVSGNFVGDGIFKFFSISMSLTNTSTALGTLSLPFGTFLNSDNNVTGKFETTGFAKDGTLLQFFTWKSSCSGGFFLTIVPQSANKLNVSVSDALDCNGSAGRVSFTMTRK